MFSKQEYENNLWLHINLTIKKRKVSGNEFTEVIQAIVETWLTSEDLSHWVACFLEMNLLVGTLGITFSIYLWGECYIRYSLGNYPMNSSTICLSNHDVLRIAIVTLPASFCWIIQRTKLNGHQHGDFLKSLHYFCKTKVFVSSKVGNQTRLGKSKVSDPKYHTPGSSPSQRSTFLSLLGYLLQIFLNVSIQKHNDHY